jgi:DNA-binding LacI/PurR family transcriptional regulator
MSGTRTPSAGPARMEDVAQLARVSTATVSQPLHTPEKVSERNRRRVVQTTRQRVAIACFDDQGIVSQTVPALATRRSGCYEGGSDASPAK